MRVWPKRSIWVHRVLGFALGSVVALILLVTENATWAVAGVPAALLYYVAATRRFRKRRKLLREPMPDSWRQILLDKVRYYRHLSEIEQAVFEDNVRIFLAEQRITPVHGARVDEEVRLLVAASAAILCQGLPDWEWPDLREILVYPGQFDDEYRVKRGAHVAGVVRAQGPIVLSQQELRHGFRRPRDGHNLGLHEFAHVMDMADGYADGVPADRGWVADAPWVEAIAKGLSKVRDDDGGSILRQYAGVNEAEFFAVAVETFFEQPHRLKERDRPLYDLLASYFAQDPASLLPAPHQAESVDDKRP